MFLVSWNYKRKVFKKSKKSSKSIEFLIESFKIVFIEFL